VFGLVSVDTRTSTNLRGTRNTLLARVVYHARLALCFRQVVLRELKLVTIGELVVLCVEREKGDSKT
jgi:hypothetical protein